MAGDAKRDNNASSLHSRDGNGVPGNEDVIESGIETTSNASEDVLVDDEAWKSMLLTTRDPGKINDKSS